MDDFVRVERYCGDRRPGLPSLLCDLPPGHEGMHAATFDGPSVLDGRGRYQWAPADSIGFGATAAPGFGRPDRWLADAVDAALADQPGPLDGVLAAVDDGADVDGVLPALLELTDQELRHAFSDLTQTQRLKLVRLLIDVVEDRGSEP